MREMDVPDWRALPLREAYQFGFQHGLEKEVSVIRDMEIEWDLSYTSSVRRGYIVGLFNEKGVLEGFKEACWPNGSTPVGERDIRKYLRIKQRYEDFLASGQQPLPNDAEELESEREFAYESDLRDYLSKNLRVIEPGLTLYADERGNGIEYPIAAGSIDILAKDRSGRLVVIELKVSRGRNRTIGQLLYYMGWVDTNLRGTGKSRGVIVAKEVSDDLCLACQRVPDISLYKYTLSVATSKVYPPAG
ncbi:MAG: DUF91 domain-containing protein [Chloroflexi bacterium]|nr:DUF91 domain-containing protein [Chloroflexota bacterium]